MDINLKSRGELKQKYKHKQNKSNHQLDLTKIYYKKGGNSTSVTGSSPAPPISRIYNKAETNDIIRHWTIDSRAEGRICRKTACDLFIPLPSKDNRKNIQKTIKGKKFEKKKKYRYYIVHLPKIYDNLYLSTYDYANNPTEKYDISINLYEEELYNNKFYKKMYHVDILDDKFNLSKDYKKKFKKCADIINYAKQNNKTVLVNCQAGTNRSVTAILTYHIFYNNNEMDLNKTIQYIEQEKIKSGYKYWDTLTSKKFKNYLAKTPSTIKKPTICE